MPSSTLVFDVVNASLGSPNVTSNDEGIYVLDYPCESSSDCTPYKVELNPGRYFFTLYRPSGASDNGVVPYRYKDNTFLDEKIIFYYRGNVKSSTNTSCAGVGGYTSGYLNLKQKKTFYIRVEVKEDLKPVNA